MKKAWLIFIIMLLLSSGCSVQTDTQEDRINQLEHEVSELQEKYAHAIKTVEEQKYEIEALETELTKRKSDGNEENCFDDFYPLLSNLSHQFTRAHTNGDLESLRKLVSERINIDLVDGVMKATWLEDDQEIEWILWDQSSDLIYRDMVIQGYGSLDDGTKLIHIREFYESDRMEVTPPTFLNLHFQIEEKEWKIVYFEFDV